MRRGPRGLKYQTTVNSANIGSQLVIGQSQAALQTPLSSGSLSDSVKTGTTNRNPALDLARQTIYSMTYSDGSTESDGCGRDPHIGKHS